MRPDNTTFLDVSAISGIPNKLGGYIMKEEKYTDVKVGTKVIQGKLIDGVTYVPVREFIEAIKCEIQVTWDGSRAGVKL